MRCNLSSASKGVADTKETFPRLLDQGRPRLNAVVPTNDREDGSPGNVTRNMHQGTVSSVRRERPVPRAVPRKGNLTRTEPRTTR